jgi:hypothetical protein
MISNERRWPSQRWSQRQPYYERTAPRTAPAPFRPPVQEDTLESREIQVERKHFMISLKENPRGRFLRITESVGGKINTIIIPAPGLRDFQKLLEEMVKAANETPQKDYSAQSQSAETDRLQ